MASHAHCTDSEFPEVSLPDNICSGQSKPLPIVRKCKRGACPGRYSHCILLDNVALISIVLLAVGGLRVTGANAQVLVVVEIRADRCNVSGCLRTI